MSEPISLMKSFREVKEQKINKFKWAIEEMESEASRIFDEIRATICIDLKTCIYVPVDDPMANDIICFHILKAYDEDLHKKMSLSYFCDNIELNYESCTILEFLTKMGLYDYFNKIKHEEPEKIERIKEATEVVINKRLETFTLEREDGYYASEIWKKCTKPQQCYVCSLCKKIDREDI